jgi:hypothetical protein
MSTVKGEVLRSEAEIKAFLLGTRAAFLLMASSRHAMIAAYGRAQLDQKDKLFHDRMKEFKEMLEDHGKVNCGVEMP